MNRLISLIPNSLKIFIVYTFLLAAIIVGTAYLTPLHGQQTKEATQDYTPQQYDSIRIVNSYEFYGVSDIFYIEYSVDRKAWNLTTEIVDEFIGYTSDLSYLFKIVAILSPLKTIDDAILLKYDNNLTSGEMYNYTISTYDTIIRLNDTYLGR